MCAFRQSYSRIDNSPEARAATSLLAVITINNIRVGRAQSVRYSGNAAPRPVQEIGSDRVIEYAPGVKTFQFSMQTLAITYGDLVKRLASMTGANIDPNSKAATLTAFPEFDIVITSSGLAQLNSPQLYAPIGSEQSLAGAGATGAVLVGCVIESFDRSISQDNTLIMENISGKFIDEVYYSGSDAPAITGAAVAAGGLTL